MKGAHLRHARAYRLWKFAERNITYTSCTSRNHSSVSNHRFSIARETRTPAPLRHTGSGTIVSYFCCHRSDKSRQQLHGGRGRQGGIRGTPREAVVFCVVLGEGIVFCAVLGRVSGFVSVGGRMSRSAFVGIVRFLKHLLTGLEA